MGNLITFKGPSKFIDIELEGENCYTKPLPRQENMKKYVKSNVETYSERTGYFRVIPPSWKKITKDVLESFLKHSTIKREDGTYIKKGTRLYHASRHCPFFYDNEALEKRDKMTFFGADPFISVWYSAEIKGKYLYVFKLKKDLKLDGKITSKKNPKDERECRKKTCIHPQYVLRCNTINPDSFYNPSGITEVGLEITVPYKKNKDHFQIEKVFELDYELLQKNCKKTLEEWDPRQAIKNEIKIKK